MTRPTAEQVAQWLKLLDGEQQWPILVHCKDGVVRSGVMAAVYETEYQGADNREVLSRLPMFGHDLHVPRREPVRQFILNYVPRGQKERKP